MGSPRANFYNRKGYWKRLVRRIDRRVLDILNRERRDPRNNPVSDYFALGHDLVKIGLSGEDLMSDAVKFGISVQIMSDISDVCNVLEMMSERLRLMAEDKWGQQLPTFPIYHTTLMATAELIEQAESVKEMNRILGKE